MADAQQHCQYALMLKQCLDMFCALSVLGGIGHSHEVKHLDAVGADLAPHAALYAAWHLLLRLDCQIKELYACAMYWQVCVNGHDSKD